MVGKILEVINDRNMLNATDGNYDQVILSWNDYYAFGMTMPGRNGGVGYRYQFNGMEHDSEVSGNGNSYTTEFRQYDPRLGRWKSLDPLMAEYPGMSPYVAFNNNPIYFVDPYGLEPVNDGSGDPPTGVEPPPTQKRGEDGNMTDWENGDTWVGKGENGEYIQYTYVKGENGANDKWTYGKINVGSETVINGKSTQPAKMDQKIRIEIQKDLFFDVTYGIGCHINFSLE